MYLSDALGLFKYWERTPPAFVSLNRIARALGAVPKTETTTDASPEPASHYSTKDEIMAFQQRVNAVQGARA